MTGPHRLAPGHTLDDLLGVLCADHEVFSARRGDDGPYRLARSEGWLPGRPVGGYRPIEPIKSIYFRPREFVGLFEISSESATAGDETPSRVAVGVKSCDLASLTVHDHVFRDSKPVDPAYASARAGTLVISADCTDCLDVCFCTAMGLQPHPRAGYDLNVATVAGAGAEDYVIEAGSPRGERELERVKPMLAPADEALLARRDVGRAALAARVAEQAAAAGLTPGLDLRSAIRNSDDALWRDVAADCVECGACNFACCTCHCFMLADGVTADGQPARTKLWDACLLKNFAHVAGGNAREGRPERLRNRFEKKFVFFRDRLGQYACDGCGRCTEVCTANIDIRAVLRAAVASEARGGGVP